MPSFSNTYQCFSIDLPHTHIASLFFMLVLQVRPLLPFEIETGAKEELQAVGQEVQICGKGGATKSFSFDQVYDSKTQQETLFQESILPLLRWLVCLPTFVRDLKKKREAEKVKGVNCSLCLIPSSETKRKRGRLR